MADVGAAEVDSAIERLVGVLGLDAACFDSGRHLVASSSAGVGCCGHVLKALDAGTGLDEVLAALIAPGCLDPYDTTPDKARTLLAAVSDESESAAVLVQSEDGRLARLVCWRGPNGYVLALVPAVKETVTRSTGLLRTTLEAMSDAISVVDPQLRVVVHNQKFVEFLDFPSGFLKPSTTLEDLFRFNARRGEYGPGDVEEQVAHRKALAAKGEPHAFRRTRPDGRVLEIRGNPLPDGGYCTTYTDVTEKARVEEELRAAKERAEQALEDLKSAQSSLIRAEKMASLGGLVAGVAHEINTPVGIGLTSASTLAAETRRLRKLYDAEDMGQEDFENYLTLAHEAADLMVGNMRRAAELIQSFKQVAVDQTSAERRSFDLGAYITEVLVSLRPALRKTAHSVTLNCPEGIPVDSFPGALSQIITNFVMNASLHAFEAGQPGAMTITVRREEPDDIELTFEDNGRGIPQDALPRIFDPFFTTRRGSGGSGLGLHIVFNLVTVTLQGRISVDSRPGHGTTFLVRFPRVAVRAEPRLT
jgi:signal transduction histidine kinase